MTKYLEYDYTDDNGVVHHVKEAQPEKSGWEKSFFIRPWIVFVIIVLGFVLFIANGINNSGKSMDRQEQYMSCLSDHLTDGQSYLCDGMKP